MGCSETNSTMKKFTVSSLPVGEVIADMARGMNIGFTNNCSYYHLRLPSHIGEGEITGIQFTSGFAMLNYDCKFYEDVQVNFTFDLVHPIKFMHCYEGWFEHHFEHGTEAHEVSKFENIAVAAQQNNGHVLHFKANQVAKICSVEIDRTAFAHKIECLLDGEEEGPVVKAIRDKEAEKEYYNYGRYSLAISRVIQQLIDMEEVNMSTILLKEGQSYTILSYQWMEFASKAGQTVLRKHEFALFMEIRDYIEQNIGKELTVESLAARFYITDKRLQSLLKSVANMTVGKYIQEYRLAKALDLLGDPTNNISEVVYQVGLKNKSYFARTFKSKYGLTPREFVKTHIR